MYVCVNSASWKSCNLITLQDSENTLQAVRDELEAERNASQSVQLKLTTSQHELETCLAAVSELNAEVDGLKQQLEAALRAAENPSFVVRFTFVFLFRLLYSVVWRFCHSIGETNDWHIEVKKWCCERVEHEQEYVIEVASS
jgi:hypothetical protein